MSALSAAHEINVRTVECLEEHGYEIPVECLLPDEELAEIITKHITPRP